MMLREIKSCIDIFYIEYVISNYFRGENVPKKQSLKKANDLTVANLMRTLDTLGYTVTRKLRVAGFDNVLQGRRQLR